MGTHIFLIQGFKAKFPTKGASSRYPRPQEGWKHPSSLPLPSLPLPMLSPPGGPRSGLLPPLPLLGEHTSGLWPQLSSGRATLTPPPGRRRLLRLRFRPPGHRRRRHSASGLLPAGPGPAPLHLDPLSGRQSPVSCIDPEAAFGGPPNNNT